MVRAIAVWAGGISSFVVFIVLACQVVTPFLQGLVREEHDMIDASAWSPTRFDEVNKKIQEGWKVTELGYDSCGNTYVYLTR